MPISVVKNTSDGESKVSKFIQKIRNEQPDQSLLSFWIKIEEIKPPSATIKNKGLNDAMFWCQKGYEMSKEGNIDNSIDYYSQGHKQDPHNFVIWYNIGCVFTKIKKPKTALNWFAKAYISNNKTFESAYALSILLYKLERYQLSLDFAYEALNSGVTIEEVVLDLKYIIAINWK